MKRCLAAVAFALSLVASSAHADTPSRVALLRDAEADAEAGRIVDAMRTTAKLVDEMPLANADREDKAAFARGLDLLARLRSQVAHLTIAVAGATPSEISVEVDGVLVTTNRNDVLVDPGEHVIVAKAPQHDTAVATVRVRPGESKGVPLTLGTRHAPITTRETSSIVHLDPKPKSAVDTTAQKEDLFRPAAYATLATGVGALVVGIGTSIMARQRIDDVNERCPNNICPASVRDDVEGARTYSQVATGAFIVSGITLATSAVLFLVAPKAASTVTATTGGFGGRF